jgi:hypothetical protein
MTRAATPWITRSSTTALTLLLLAASPLARARDGDGDGDGDGKKASSQAPPASTRFAPPEGAEVPDFQRHVLPLLGRLGCNSRACHGSFQGQGGLRLSLFGYDFQADHQALLAKNEGRVDVDAPESSLILQKAAGLTPHKGGKLLDEGDWSYNLLARWVEGGALPVQSSAPHFDRLEVLPPQIVFNADGPTTPLRVVAHWSDGSTEDVTPLTRFQTNDESIATVSPEGLVASAGTGDTHVVAFYDNGVFAVPVLRPVSDQVGAAYPNVPTTTEIDRLVVAKLRTLGIVPSETCTDAEFLRRVSLDLTGSLPTPQEASEFAAASHDPDRRSKAIARLLDSPAYAAYWANRLGDLLGNSPQAFQNMPGAASMSRLWYDWMRARLAANTPYDQIVEGIVLANGRDPNQSYDDYRDAEAAALRDPANADPMSRDSMPYFWARRNLRQPEEKALAFSYAFLGVRLECAQCHKHPYDQWTQADFDRFKAFFTPIRYALPPEGQKLTRALRDELTQPAEPGGKPKPISGGDLRREVDQRLRQGQPIPVEELLIQGLQNPARRALAQNKKPDPKNRKAAAARVPSASVLGGDTIDLTQTRDPRQPIMDWMRSPENPYFARSIVNRVWAAHFGHGIIDPADDSNLANPPSNAPLLDHLATGFVAHNYDLKWLHRTILESDTYQRSWRPNPTNRLDDRNFSHALVRRLPAESLVDAVKQATASAPLLAKFETDMDLRAFGPTARAAGRRTPSEYAATLFGRSTRETNCDCSRSDAPNLLQSIYLQNDNDIHSAISRPDGWVASLIASASRSKPQNPSRPKPAPPGDDPAKAKLRDRAQADPQAAIAALEKRLSRLPDTPATADQRQKIRNNLARLRRLAADSKSPGSDPTAANSPLSRDPASLIDEAYLRTLSRPPTPDEAAIAAQHFNQADAPAEALRDLLWALLNTKEFVTNH